MAGKKKKAPEAGMRFTDFVDEVRSRSRIDRLLEQDAGVRLNGSGASRSACCPFHEDRTPSFSVNVTSGLYKCHSAGCGAQGDVFGLLMSLYNTDFRGAVILAAEKAGVPIPESFADDHRKVCRETPERRRSIRYPRDAIGAVPDGLSDHALAALPEESRLPVPGRPTQVWNPDRAPHLRRYTPRMVHAYRTTEGAAIAAVLRCEKKELRNGKPDKIFIPLKLSPLPAGAPREMGIGPADAPLAWTVGGPGGDCYRPLYGLEHAPAWSLLEDRSILVVDGEKTVDAARRLLEASPQWLPVSVMGGGSSTLRADWRPLLGMLSDEAPVTVAVWPDADAPMRRPDGEIIDRQAKYASSVLTGFFQAVRDAGLAMSRFRAVRIAPPEGVASGWDLADAEAEGWSGGDVIAVLGGRSRDIDPSGFSFREEFQQEHDVMTGAAETVESIDIDAEIALRELDEALDRDVPADLPGELPMEEVEGGATPEVLEGGGDGEEGDPDPYDPIFRNPYFRCLGHRDGVDYFVSLESGHIYGLSPSMLKPSYFLKLARKEWWMTNFPGGRSRNGDVTGVDWESALDALIAGSYAAGVWDPSREIGQGACMDGGRVVFNTGQLLHVEGLGLVPIREFRGDNCYVMGPPSRTPAFEDPIGAGDAGVLQFLEIIRSLNWRPERRSLSVMALFGWIAIGPIAGILKWRPHLWLDGPRSSGKSWIINHLISPILGDYCVLVKSNSTESGIRNALHSRAFPLIFDEAEGESRQDRDRIDAIIRMARHSSSEGRSVVLQGTVGGGGQRHFSIRSPFLFCSITSQLEAAADKTRFAHAQLNEGRGLDEFARTIEGPAMDLLTEEFSARFTARMVLRAPDLKQTFVRMVHALTTIGLERRLADVYGTFAAGAWLLMRDGVPEDHVEAMEFLIETFDIMMEIREHGEEVSEDKDHVRLCRILQSTAIRVESANMGVRMERLGQMFSAAAGLARGEGCVSQAEAMAVLKDIGIRPAVTLDDQGGFELIEDGEEADCLVLHRNSVQIREILANTSYGRSYCQVLSQAGNVRNGRLVRFSPSAGVSRTIVVPLENFSITKEDDRGS